MAQKYSEKETEKQYNQIDNVGLLTELASRLENKPLNVIDQVKFELSYLEYVVYTNPKINAQYYVVTDYKTYKEVRKPYVTLHNLKTGEDVKTRIKSVKIYEANPFGLYSILKVNEFAMSPKTKCINGQWEKTEEMEKILESYEVIK